MTKGQMESCISNKMVAFQREQLGRGAEEAKSFIIKDMVIVRMENVLAPAEKHLVQTERGKSLIKEIRDELEILMRKKLDSLIQDLTGAKVLSIHNDISTKTGERIDIFILDHDLESQLQVYERGDRK